MSSETSPFPPPSESLLAGRYGPGPVLWDHPSSRVTVLSATDTWLGDSVVVAVLGPTADENATAAFRARARAWSRLYQPGIMELRDLVTWKGAPLAVWDAPTGGTLAELMATGIVGAGRVERMTAELAAALDLLAAEGIVHAHLHPGAVGMDGEGHAQLLPWPATSAPSGYGGESAWQAPEVLAGAAPDHLSDRWSLGAVGLSALVGTGPGPLDGGQTLGLAGRLRRRTSASLLSALTTYMAPQPGDRLLAPVPAVPVRSRPAPVAALDAPVAALSAPMTRLRPVAARLAHAVSSRREPLMGGGLLTPGLVRWRPGWGWPGIAGVVLAGAILAVVPRAVAQPSIDNPCPTCQSQPMVVVPPASAKTSAPTSVQLSRAATLGARPSAPGAVGAANVTSAVHTVPVRPAMTPAPNHSAAPAAVASSAHRFPSAGPTPGGAFHQEHAHGEGQFGHRDSDSSGSPGSSGSSHDQG